MQELRAWVVSFLTVREVQGLSPSTLAQDKAFLERFEDWCQRTGTSLLTLTPRVLERYVKTLERHRAVRGQRRGLVLARSTVACHLRTLKVWTRFLVEHGVLLLDPLKTIHRPGSRSVCGRGLFREEELAWLFRATTRAAPISLRDRAILALLYGCGLRLGELVNLDLGDIDLVGGSLRLRRTKGGQCRVVPMGPRTCRDVQVYLEGSRPWLCRRTSGEALFLGREGRRLSGPAVRARVREIQRRAGLNPVRPPHALRHSCATHMLRAGAGIAMLQRLLGHQRLETTARYTAVDLADLRAVIATRHPRERDRGRR